MASYIEEFKSYTDWGTVIVRSNKTPLDRSSIFGSLDDAKKYALGDGSDSRLLGRTSYVGQIITVYENNEVEVYKINADREIEPISHGKGTLITIDENETTEIISNEKFLGQFIYQQDNKTMYFINEVNKKIELFQITDENNIIIDCGEY